MSSNPDVFMANNDQGVARVMQGDYAYLMESASIEYITERNCNLTQIGGLLDSKGYGIATRKGNNWNELILLSYKKHIVNDLLVGTWKTVKEQFKKVKFLL